MDTLYRVKKDNKTFFIQPDMIKYYADNGYSIYKTIEIEITDIQEEIDNYQPSTQSTTVQLSKGVNNEDN